jgi:glycosyltransferase involved in cell wall biosynthesis
VNFLFVHQNFPGQYLHIVRSLLEDNKVREGTHQIVFMSEPNQNNIPGVRKVTYAKPPKPSGSTNYDAREFDMAMRRAQAAYQGAQQLKALNFQPDIIIGHHGWGEMLNLCDVFPGVPILGYFEFFYKIHGTDVNFDPEFQMGPERFGSVRAKNGVNLLALDLGQHGQTPTLWQRSTYPDWAQSQMHLIEEGVDLEICKPDATLRTKKFKAGKITVAPNQKLVTYVARNLEPYRGFHTVMRALPRILDERPDIVVSIVGGDEISYGAPHSSNKPWREVLLKELEGQIDTTRVFFPGKIPYEQHLALLKRSDAHIYLSYPFVASWSLREAMACGCLVIGADTPTVQEFITHKKTGLTTPTTNAAALAETVLKALENPRQASKIRAAARSFAEAHLDLKDYLIRYRAAIETITGRPLVAPPASAGRRKKVSK